MNQKIVNMGVTWIFQDCKHTVNIVKKIGKRKISKITGKVSATAMKFLWNL